MNAPLIALNAAAAALLAGLAVHPADGVAGPCSGDISELSKALGKTPDLGPATTGALAGSAPGVITPKAQPDAASKTGTSAAGGKLGGTGATKELNAASNQIATSSEDVRRQQKGEPTTAAAGAAANGVETKPAGGAAASSNRLSEAKAELDRARALDANGDQACVQSVKQAKSLM